MSAGIRAFVNERPVEVAAGASALDAVMALDADLGGSVAAGQSYLTDGRGVRCEADTPLAPGAILRVLPVRTARDPDA